MQHFEALFAANPADFADLYLDVGDLLVEQRCFDKVRSATALALVPVRYPSVVPCRDAAAVHSCCTKLLSSRAVLG